MMLHQKTTYFIIILAICTFSSDDICLARESKNASSLPILAGQVDYRTNLVIAPEGQWEVYTARDNNGTFKLERTRSFDEGKTWTAPDNLRGLLDDGWAGAVSLLDRDNEVHLFFARWRNKEGRKPAVDRFIDLWHLRSSDGRAAWTEPQRIFKGYVRFYTVCNSTQQRKNRAAVCLLDRRPSMSAAERFQCYDNGFFRRRWC